MTNSDRQFQLLMSEKEFADSQIGAFFDLHVKVLAFLGAALVLLGWLYSDKSRMSAGGTVAVIALAVVMLGCSVILQGIVVYGTALGYLEYKVTTLRDGFKRSDPQLDPPIPGFWRWRSSPVQFPVVFAAAGLFAMHAAISIILLYVAWYYQPASWLFVAALCGAGSYLIITLAGEVLIFRAARSVMRVWTDAEIRPEPVTNVGLARTLESADPEQTA